MADPSLFSDGQVAALVTSLLAAGGGIAGSIKWGVGRLVKAIDDQAADSKLVREVVTELKVEVREGREDIRELRTIAEAHFEPRKTRPTRKRRAATAPVT